MNGKHILIVDQDEAVLDAVSRLLKKAGYFTITSDNCGLLLEDSLKEVDLIILDAMLQLHDKRKVIFQLKTNEKYKNIPILILSTTNQLEAPTKAEGADGFLEKPFEINDLLEKVSELTKN